MLTIFTASFIVMLSACSSAQASLATELAFNTIDKGFMSGVRQRQLLVIKSEAQWKEIWQVHVGLVSPAREVPSIDFDKEMVVAVFLGERSSGGYGVEIKAVEQDREKRQLRVVLRETKPAGGAMVIQALTQPYHIVKVKKSELPVTFTAMP